MLRKGCKESWMSFGLLDGRAQNERLWRCVCGGKIKIMKVGDDQRWESEGLYSESDETALVL